MDIPQPRQICGRPSYVQMRALLDELEAHPHLARGRMRGPDGRRRSDNLWRQLSQRLNAIDGCTKSHKQWQKFWADKKSAVKKAVASKQAEGDSISTSVFSEIDLRIINFIETGETDQDEGSSSKSPIEDFEYTMSDSEELHEENPLIEVPVETNYIYEIKKEPHCSRTSTSLRPRRPIKKKFNRAKLFSRIMRLEKRRTENEEKTSHTLASIAACMKRQEEATQRLTRVLLQLIPRDNMSVFQPRMQSSRPSVEQVNALLDELEANPYLAQGKLRKRSTPLWTAITRRLNLIEGCKKNCKQWMKYWSDKKVAVKRMLEVVRVSTENNGPDLVATFTDIEHRVIAILENPILIEGQTDFAIPDSPSMEAEYLENLDNDYVSDGNDTLLEDVVNPLIGLPVIDRKVLRVKQEPSTMKQSSRNMSLKQSTTSAKRSRSRSSFPQMWQKLLRMEERRVAAQESISNTLLDIETTMRRQEEATRELARVLLRLLR